MLEPSRFNDTVLEYLERRVAMLATRAGERLGIRLPAFRVRADLRGLAAGRCQLRRQRGVIEVTIRFNARVLDETWLLDDALAETAPHEVAHGAIAVWAQHEGRLVQPHGPEWLALCRALGGSGRTTHKLHLKRARRHWEYEYRLAGGQAVWLGTLRHRRLQSGQALYYWRQQPVLAGDFTGRARLKQ